MRPTSRGWCWAASATPRTGWRGPRRSTRTWNPRDREIGRLYAGYQKALTEASALDFDDLLLKTVELFDRVPGGAGALRAALPVRDGRRVPGHQPAAVPAGQAARQRAPQPVRGRRPRSVDLQVARRRPAQHPGLRARLPRGRRRPARAQLSLDAGDPRRRLGGDCQQPQSQGEDALDRPEGRRARSRTSAAPTSSKRPSSSPASARQAISRRRRTRRSRCCTAPTPSRARWKTRCARPASPTLVLGGVGFYERKEIKDALGYLKLILNPHDDVALRRVINVPPRGIGKGVMDALEQVDAGPGARRPAAAAGRPAADRRASNSLWAKLVDAPSTSGCSRRGRSRRWPPSATC